MRHRMTTMRDLRNWVDGQTSDWDTRSPMAIDAIAAQIQAMSHPQWGADWTDFLDALPDLADMAEWPAPR